MTLLLDTHAVLWLLAGDRRAAGIARTVAAERGPVLLSAVCLWEAAIKSALGKLRVPADLPARLDEFAFEHLPISGAHAWTVRKLPAVHSDPFDRLLVAQAVCERADIASADEVFDAYGVTRRW